MTLELMTHHCAEQSSENKNRQEVMPFDIQYDTKCEVCGQSIAPVREVLAYIYAAVLLSK